MIYPFELFRRKWRRRFSRSEWGLRRLRLSTSQDTGSEPGLLLIQIDGLARKQLERALASGRMPFLQSLLNKQHYDLKTFYSGIPSTTPAVQGELFYGVKCAVPSFSFLNRKARHIATMFEPEWVKAIEADLKKKGEGLLTGGSSWSNIYTGGATLEESHFCAASIGKDDLLKTISPLGFLSMVILHFPAILRMMALLIREVFLALWDVIDGIRHGEPAMLELKFVVSRVFVCIGFREAIKIGAAIDLARGLPIIHANFLGYDEQSHRRGPDSTFAHLSLSGIDSAIKHLYREARTSTRRDYQVWIYSDHGQERATSYRVKHPHGIERTVAEGVSRVLNIEAGRQSASHQETDFRIFGAVATTGNDHQPPSTGKESDSLPPKTSALVTALGPVGHVYLDHQVSEEKRRELADWLVEKGDVPGVLYLTDSGSTVWIHRNGSLTLPDEAASVLPHSEPLRSIVANDMVLLSQQKYAGDLILLGWSPNNPPQTFALERGAHGGLGLDETRGFALLPPKTRLPETAKEFIRPMDLRAAALHRLERKKLLAVKAVRPPPALHVQHLRVMTYNVHSCMGMDGKISPRRIARIIDHYDPDIVALQEIDLGRARTRGHDQAQMIADELGMHVSFCPTVIRGNELYGHALLSRSPLEGMCSGVLSPGPKGEKREPRGVHYAQVKYHGTTIHILNTHFGLSRFERAAQVADLLGDHWIGRIASDEPLILCGDFNMLPGSIPYRALAMRLRDVQEGLEGFQPLKTFSTIFPFSRIDHIFVSPHFAVNKVRVPKNHLTQVASDHLPLIADLSLNTRKP